MRDAQLPDNEFDAIVSFHVIERFFDPAAELRDMMRGIEGAPTPVTWSAGIFARL